MNEAYTLDEIHEEIAEVYRWWARNAPGVTPREGGHLGALWAIQDRLVEEQRGLLGFDAFKAEYGRGNR